MPAQAQNFHLYIHTVDKNDSLLTQLNIKNSFATRVQCRQYVQQLPVMLQSKGYLSASIDSVKEDSTSAYMVLFIGEQYHWRTLQIEDKDVFLISQLGLKREWFIKQPVNQQRIIQLQEKLLDYFEDNGYPFAKIQFDSVHLEGMEVSAKLMISKGILYKLDSIRVWGNAKISHNFLYHYLDIEPGQAFSREKLNLINQRLLELPFLQQSKDWDITMLSDSYLLNLYLQPKHSNEINVLVGFLPANQEVGGKLLLTGNADLNLKNAFAMGETIGLNWQQLQSASPRLTLEYQKPYIFNSNFGIDFNFDLYKKDSTYLNLDTKLGAQYVLSAKQSGKVFLETFKTNLLDVDTVSVIVNKRLPDIIDESITNLTLEYQYSNTNYKFNPRRGNEFLIDLSAGNKKIKKNNSILQLSDTSFDYNSLYDTIQLNSYQVKVRLGGAQYFPVGRQSVIKAGLNAGWIQSPQYFRNEMFQLGGYKLMRGFDEESIVANGFMVGTFEYRYLLRMNSYFNGFIDMGWSKNNISLESHTYIGTGIGLALETKQGIFNISFAEGKRNDLPFNLRESKIHIGFVSIF